MKKALLTILMLIAYVLPAHAGDEKSFSLQTSPAIGMVGVEYKLTDKLSLSANVAAVNIALENTNGFLLPFSNTYNNVYLSTKYAYGARMSWYPKGVFHRGVYFSGFIDSITFNYENSTYNSGSDILQKGEGTTQDLGVTFGYQWIWSDYISLHAGAGTVYIKGTSLDTTKTTTTYNSVSNSVSTSSSPSSDTLDNQISFTLDLYVGFLF